MCFFLSSGYRCYLATLVVVFFFVYFPSSLTSSQPSRLTLPLSSRHGRTIEVCSYWLLEQWVVSHKINTTQLSLYAHSRFADRRSGWWELSLRWEVCLAARHMSGKCMRLRWRILRQERRLLWVRERLSDIIFITVTLYCSVTVSR